MEASNEQVSKKSQLIGVETMRSVCFKNLHYQGVVWPPPRAWPSNSAQHFRLGATWKLERRRPTSEVRVYSVFSADSWDLRIFFENLGAT